MAGAPDLSLAFDELPHPFEMSVGHRENLPRAPAGADTEHCLQQDRGDQRQGKMGKIEGQGKIWGARHETVKRAETASWQAFELLMTNELLADDCETVELETHP